MPSDVPRRYQSDFFYLRALLRLDLKDKPGAAEDLDTAVSVWPARSNRALDALEDLYRQAGDTAALASVRRRVERRGP
jgi:hypothetical protein